MLPIRQYQDGIIASVRNNPVTVVIGETGSGKTTQISQILEEAGFVTKNAIIAVTQPRRVAAVTVARRVAEEKKWILGGEVGYAVRFEDKTSPVTRIKYLTDGTLLREALDDPLLQKYSVIVLDEAHERSLATDILFGLLKPLAKQGLLKLVITSATLDGEKFAKYFDDCPVFNVPGRCHPVDIIHSMEDHSTTYFNAAMETAIDIHCHQPPGDILLFLTGQAEIDKAVEELTRAIQSLDTSEAGPLLILPLYAALPPEMQARIFAPSTSRTRRCIVSTNVAETSVTVDGVVYVIDPGVVKQKEHNPATGMESLEIVPISRVQATQRAGRAGRTRPGKCYRLYTKKYYDREMPIQTLPEIQRTSLVSSVLQLKSITTSIDVLKFDYLDPPSSESLCAALRQLYLLGAIDEDGGMTEIGRSMSRLPLDPSLSRALIEATKVHCLDDMLTVAAMLSPDTSIFIGSKGPEQVQQELRVENRRLLEELMEEELGDHILYLKLYKVWILQGKSTEWCKSIGVDGRALRFASNIRHQLGSIMLRATEHEKALPPHFKKPKRDSDHRYKALRMALVVGFANKLARRMPSHNGYRTLGDFPALAQVHPSNAPLRRDEDGLLPEWVLYHELVSTTKVFLSKVCPMERRWVDHILPRLQNIDVGRLSGGSLASNTHTRVSERKRHETNSDAQQVEEKRNKDDAISAARARYAARKSKKIR